MVGAALGELSLLRRIDTDLESLTLLDATDTGRPLLDPILREIATETEPHDARYWIERLAPQSESAIPQALDGLVRRQILNIHPGGFYCVFRSMSWPVAQNDAEPARARHVAAAVRMPVVEAERHWPSMSR